MYAPIVIFAYNRPNHLEKVLRGLADNPEAIESDLYIFIDGPKKLSLKEVQETVRKVANKETEGNFKKTEIICSEKNKGLSKSVISGVTKVINHYGRVIVLEDDTIPSNIFLRYMNDALNFFEEDQTVWSVSAYIPPIMIPADYAYDLVRTQRASSQTWGTWKDRWEKCDWVVNDYKRFRLNFYKRYCFNLWGNDSASMLDDQMTGRINSWAVRFNYSQFNNGMYSILTKYSLVKNCGADGSGTHKINVAPENDKYYIADNKKLKSVKMTTVSVDERIRKEYISIYHSCMWVRIKRYIADFIRPLVEQI